MSTNIKFAMKIFRYILIFSDAGEIIVSNTIDTLFKENLFNYLQQTQFPTKYYTFEEVKEQFYEICELETIEDIHHKYILQQFLQKLNSNDQMKLEIRIKYKKNMYDENIATKENLKFYMQIINIDFDSYLYRKLEHINVRRCQHDIISKYESEILIRSVFFKFLKLKRRHFELIFQSLMKKEIQSDISEKTEFNFKRSSEQNKVVSNSDTTEIQTMNKNSKHFTSRKKHKLLDDLSQSDGAVPSCSYNYWENIHAPKIQSDRKFSSSYKEIENLVNSFLKPNSETVDCLKNQTEIKYTDSIQTGAISKHSSVNKNDDLIDISTKFCIPASTPHERAENQSNHNIILDWEKKKNPDIFSNSFCNNYYSEVYDEQGVVLFKFFANNFNTNQKIQMKFDQFCNDIMMQQLQISIILIDFIKLVNYNLLEIFEKHMMNCSIVLELTLFILTHSLSKIYSFFTQKDTIKTFLDKLRKKNYIFFQLGNAILEFHNELHFKNTKNMKIFGYSSEYFEYCFTSLLEIHQSTEIFHFPTYFCNLTNFMIMAYLDSSECIVGSKRIIKSFSSYSNKLYDIFLVHSILTDKTKYMEIHNLMNMKFEHCILINKEQTIGSFVSSFSLEKAFDCFFLIKNCFIIVILDENLITIEAKSIQKYEESDNASSSYSFHGNCNIEQKSLLNVHYLMLRGLSFIFYQIDMIKIISESKNSYFYYDICHHQKKLEIENCTISLLNFQNCIFNTISIVNSSANNLLNQTICYLVPLLNNSIENCVSCCSITNSTFSNNLIIYCDYETIIIDGCESDFSLNTKRAKNIKIMNNQGSIVTFNEYICMKFINRKSFFEYDNSLLSSYYIEKKYKFINLIITNSVIIFDISFNHEFTKCSFESDAKLYIANQKSSKHLDVFTILGYAENFSNFVFDMHIIEGKVISQKIIPINEK